MDKPKRISFEEWIHRSVENPVYANCHERYHELFKQCFEANDKYIDHLEKENIELTRYIEFFSNRLIKIYGENERLDYHVRSKELYESKLKERQ